MDRRELTKTLLAGVAALAMPFRTAFALRSSYELRPAAIDWTEDGVNWHTDPVPEGVEIQLRCLIRNTGTIAVPPRYPIQVEFQVEGERLATIDTAGGLGAKKSLQVVGPWWPTVAGRNMAAVIVDPANLFRAEENEANNLYIASLVVFAEGETVTAATEEEKKPSITIMSDAETEAFLRPGKMDTDPKWCKAWNEVIEAREVAAAKGNHWKTWPKTWKGVNLNG
jgi:hypothetical protein